MNGEAEEVSSRELKGLESLAQRNFSKFAMQVEHLSTEVQMKLIAQLPEFQKLANGALDKLSDAHRETLRSMNQNEAQVNEGFAQWRDSLRSILDDPSLTLEEKLKVTAEIGRTVQEQANLQRQNHAAKAAVLGKVAVASLAVVGAVVVAVTGGKFGIDQGDKGS